VDAPKWWMPQCGLTPWPCLNPGLSCTEKFQWNGYRSDCKVWRSQENGFTGGHCKASFRIIQCKGSSPESRATMNGEATDHILLSLSALSRSQRWALDVMRDSILRILAIYLYSYHTRRSVLFQHTGAGYIACRCGAIIGVGGGGVMHPPPFSTCGVLTVLTPLISMHWPPSPTFKFVVPPLDRIGPIIGICEWQN